MEYGLRRYEATQRLLWFLFFLFCLWVAYVMSDSQGSLSTNPPHFQVEFLKSFSFWTQMQWVRLEPFGKFIIYLVRVFMLFLGVRTLWLILQHVGKYLLKYMLTSTLNHSTGRPKAGLDGMIPSPERLFPSDLLLQKVSFLPLQIFFHPYQRLRMLLNHPQGSYSSEELNEKERRIVETDWQILWSSWTPFRWLLWCLPLLGLMESSWLVYHQLQPALQAQKEIMDVVSRVLTCLLPLMQTVVITVFFSLMAGILKRLENHYLSNVDAMIYDQFLSRLPFQSSDTLILLETMQRHFQELQRTLRRLERSVESEKEPQATKS